MRINKNYIIGFIAGSAIVATTVLLTSTSYNKYYFSATGNDANTGDSAHPFKTITKLNSLLAVASAGYKFVLNRGDTFYGAINIKKSGTSSAPIVLGAYGQGANPVITLLTKISFNSTSNPNIWESSTTLAVRPQIVLMNNEFCRIGRYPNYDAPNKGWLLYEAHSGATSITDNELPPTPNWSGAEVVIRPVNWEINRRKILSHVGGKLTFNPITGYIQDANKYGYFFQEALRCLDQKGEHYFNSTTKKLSIYSDVKPTDVEVSTAGNIITAINYSYVTIDGIDLIGANQDAIDLEGGSGFTIKNLSIKHSGSEAIMAKKHLNITLDNVTAFNSLSNGIRIDIANGVKVTNCKIDGTMMYAGMNEATDEVNKNAGIGLFTRGDNVLDQHNEITRSGFFGLYFRGSNVSIFNNRIDSFCLRKSDGAGIYSYVGVGNTVVTNNQKIIGNIVSNGIGAPEGGGASGLSSNPNLAAEGIYLDAMTHNVDVSGNTTFKNSRGLYIHYANNINIHDNTFFDNKWNAMISNRNKSGNLTRNCSFKKNIMVAKTTKQDVFQISGENDPVTNYGVQDSNYYAKPLSDIKTMGWSATFSWVLTRYTLADWQAKFTAWDRHSKKSPKTYVSTTNPDSVFKFLYNASKKAVTYPLATNYIDVKNNYYSGSVTLQPYTSLVLMIK